MKLQVKCENALLTSNLESSKKLGKLLGTKIFLGGAFCCSFVNEVGMTRNFTQALFSEGNS